MTLDSKNRITFKIYQIWHSHSDPKSFTKSPNLAVIFLLMYNISPHYRVSSFDSPVSVIQGYLGRSAIPAPPAPPAPGITPEAGCVQAFPSESTPIAPALAADTADAAAVAC